MKQFNMITLDVNLSMYCSLTYAVPNLDSICAVEAILSRHLLTSR